MDVLNMNASLQNNKYYKTNIVNYIDIKLMYRPVKV